MDKYHENKNRYQQITQQRKMSKYILNSTTKLNGAFVVFSYGNSIKQNVVYN